MFLPLNWRDMGLMDELLDGLETGWMTTSTGTTNSSMSGNQKCAASLKGPYLKQCCSVSLSMGLSAPSAFCGLHKAELCIWYKECQAEKTPWGSHQAIQVCKGDSGLLAKWAHMNLIKLNKVRCKTLHLVQDILWYRTHWAKKCLRTALQRMGCWWMTNWI